MSIADEVKQTIEAERDRIYRFWFSAKQRECMEQTRETNGRLYHSNFITIGGKRQEYTECMSGEFLERKSNWDDAVYLGETTFGRGQR